jgi:ribosome maturation factor RimP
VNSTIDLNDIALVIREIVTDLGLRFYDLEYNGVTRTLRVYIDKEKGGVTIKDCQRTSNFISRELQASELISFPYTLEVSSPGIARVLKRPEHYSWAMGNVVEIDTGEEKVKGYLRGTRGEGIIVATKDSENIIPFSSIKKARVVEEINHGKRS